MTDSPPPPETLPIAAITEKKLAEKMGLDRSVLVDLRLSMLALGAEWFRAENNAIVLTAAGVARVCAHLHLTPPELEPAPGPEKNGPEKNAVPKAIPLLQLIVTRAARLNRRIIFAQEKEKDGAPEIPVRVRDASVFVRGQEIQAVLHGTVATLHGPQPRPRLRRPAPAAKKP